MEQNKFSFKTPFLEMLKINRYNINEDEDIELSFNLELLPYDIMEENNQTQLGIRVGINLDNIDANIPYSLDMLMKADFMWDSDVDNEMLKLFLTQSAPMLLISYARPLVASVTNSTKYPGFELPFIDLTNYID